MSDTLIQPYLFFNGRCEEAVEFYREALGAEVEMMMRYGESPEPPPPSGMPEGWAAKVMHVTLRVGGAVLMASDGNQADPRFLGFCLSLSLPSQAETERAFAALANGGQVHMPLAKTFWSPCFGMVQDRFGVGWMVSVAATVG